jgi:hypothetical protein
MAKDEYSDYLKKLRASIDPKALKAARASTRSRARKKALGVVGKTMLTLGGVALGVGGVVALNRASKDGALARR